MSGTLCCEEKDNVTGFSYFLEVSLCLSSISGQLTIPQAFEGYDTCKDIRAVRTLKYMCLCKVCISPSIATLLLHVLQILGGHPNEVPSLLSGKHGMKYSEGGHVGTTELEAMAAVARAAKKRSLEEFEATVPCPSFLPSLLCFTLFSPFVQPGGAILNSLEV
jgi:26S proteasome regulatory subunit N6